MKSNYIGNLQNTASAPALALARRTPLQRVRKQHAARGLAHTCITPWKPLLNCALGGSDKLVPHDASTGQSLHTDPSHRPFAPCLPGLPQNSPGKRIRPNQNIY